MDALIDYQNYPVNAAKASTLNRRSLGIGYIGLAHYLAKNNGVPLSPTEKICNENSRCKWVSLLITILKFQKIQWKNPSVQI